MSRYFLISDQAFFDISEAGKWYDQQRAGLSVDFELCLEAGFEDIQSWPEGYQLKYREVRVRYIKRFPYGIHYLLEEDVIYVLAVFHTGKDPNSWIERLDH